MKITALILIVLAVSVTPPTSAQQPEQPTHQDLMNALSDLRKEAAETKAEVKRLRATQAQRQAQREVRQRQIQAEQERQRERLQVKKKEIEAERQKKRTIAAEKRLNAAKEKLDILRRDALIQQNIDARLADLDAGIIRKDATPEAQRLLISALVVERARLKEKIRKSNNKRRCRWLRIGCIK